MSTTPPRRRATRVLVTAAALSVLAAPAAPAAARPAGRPVDRTSAVFDPSHVHEISFEIAPADVARLRVASSDRVPARMVFDGTVLDQVGVRLKQGYGTAVELDEKAGFSIRTDEFLRDQGLRGVRRFTLGNSLDDPSFVAEQITYDVFRAAGIPAERTALANVRLNGELMGLYVLREVFDERFLRRNFVAPEGDLYEGGYGVDMSDLEMELRTNERSSDKSDVVELGTVVRDTPDDEYLAAVGELVDLDQLFRYWATESVTGHWDGYVGASNLAFGALDQGVEMGNRHPNNYYAYHDPSTGRFVVLPHGADYSLGNGIGDARMAAVSDPKLGATTAARLRTLAGTEERLRAAVRDVIDRAWDTPVLLARADALAALVRANGLTASREQWTLDDFEAAFAARRAFIAERADAVRAELDR